MVEDKLKGIPYKKNVIIGRRVKASFETENAIIDLIGDEFGHFLGTDQ